MNLIDIVPGLRRVGAEYKGPCPYCGGGDDRFIVWPNKGIKKTGSFWCRQCAHKGDLATYLSEIRGMDMKEALDIAGKPLDQTTNVGHKWRKLISEPEVEYEPEPAYESAPTEFVLHAMTTAYYRGDTTLYLHLLNIMSDRMKLLLRVFRRYEERHAAQLESFVSTELQVEPEDLFNRIGIRPGPRVLALEHIGTWIGENSCKHGCEGKQCEHMAPFHFLPDHEKIHERRKRGDILPEQYGGDPRGD